MVGGVLYSVGPLFMLPNAETKVSELFGFHELFHLFVLLEACHYWLMWGYICTRDLWMRIWSSGRPEQQPTILIKVVSSPFPAFVWFSPTKAGIYFREVIFGGFPGFK